MKNLRDLKVSVLALILGLLAVSCTEKEKDITDIIPDNSKKTAFNGTRYNLKKGFFQDGGAQNLVGVEESHYNHNFFLTDGNVTFKNDGSLQNSGDAKIIIMAGLLAPGTSGFTTGTYEYTNIVVDTNNLTDAQFDAKYRNRNVLIMGTVLVDTDGDKNFTEEVTQTVSGGTIKVTGTKPNYTLEYDLTFQGGKTLKGSYHGTYQEVNN